MPNHINIPEVYFLLIAMALGQPVKTLPQTAKLDLVIIPSTFYFVDSLLQPD
jgi:hypothetical protein